MPTPNSHTPPNNLHQEAAMQSLLQSTEDDAAYMATLTGEQHLANATQLIKAIYKAELKQPFDKTIRTK